VRIGLDGWMDGWTVILKKEIGDRFNG